MDQMQLCMSQNAVKLRRERAQLAEEAEMEVGTPPEVPYVRKT